MLNLTRNRLKKLRSDERGTSVLEMAIVAPVLAMFVMGIGDLGRGFSERHSLQQAANRTMELAHLGTAEENYNFLIAEAATAAGVPQSSVSLDDWVECNGTRNEDFAATCAEGQQIARYIRLTINSTFVPAFSSIGYPNVRADGSVPISADVALRVQ
jgi:hypothetical protein